MINCIIIIIIIIIIHTLACSYDIFNQPVLHVSSIKVSGISFDRKNPHGKKQFLFISPFRLGTWSVRFPSVCLLWISQFSLGSLPFSSSLTLHGRIFFNPDVGLASRRIAMRSRPFWYWSNWNIQWTGPHVTLRITLSVKWEWSRTDRRAANKIRGLVILLFTQ
jgi:hypothetical protein